MPKASVKRLIECKKDQLIDLVLDIEKYPEFVPFCLGSHVYEKNKEGNQTLIIADLTIGKGPFKDTYKSDVKFNKERYVTLAHEMVHARQVLKGEEIDENEAYLLENTLDNDHRKRL